MGEESLKSILVVENETTVRESLRDWLIETGYSVDTANDGEEALKAVCDRDFCLVLLAQELPGKDGIRVLQECRTMKPELKTIITTASPSIQIAVQAIKSGAVDYVIKPVCLDDLEKLILRTLNPAQDETVAVVREEWSLELTFSGWEYIDSYLDSATQTEEGHKY
jgi:DNA-binding NtrC family response regulator